MTDANLAHQFLDALAQELAKEGYGILKKNKIARSGSQRFQRAHGPGVTGVIDVGPAGGYIWLDVNGITYAVQTFWAPKNAEGFNPDASTIEKAVASIMTPLTYRSDLDPISENGKAA